MTRAVRRTNRHHRFHNQGTHAPPVDLSSAIPVRHGGVGTARPGFVNGRNALTATRSTLGPTNSRSWESGRSKRVAHASTHLAWVGNVHTPQI